MMDPAQYTPDTICRSMGLPAFVEREWSLPTVRLLLMPSFHPEVCITLVGPTEKAQLSVVALAEMLWRQPAFTALTAWREHVAVTPAAFTQATAGFASAMVADREQDGQMVCLDGMPVSGCRLTDTGLEQFACHPYRSAVSAFVSSLIQLAWETSRGAGVRNALAECGRYVGLDLPREPEPSVPKLFRLAVLGTPDARADFFGQLQQREHLAEPGSVSSRD